MSIVYEYLDYDNFIKRARVEIHRQSGFYHPVHYFTLHSVNPLYSEAITYAYITVEAQSQKVLVTVIKVASKHNGRDFEEWAEKTIEEHKNAIVKKLKHDLKTDNIQWGVYCRELADIREFRVLSSEMDLEELKESGESGNGKGNS